MTEKKVRILVVEDYAPNVLVATSFLETLGYAFDTAASGEEALQKFAAARYDAVLMDVQMPGMDGLEAARRMRALEKEKNLAAAPIIAVTGHATQDDLLFAKRAGMDACLSKPFTLATLGEALRSALVN
jgi:CheY-like chemotaxis protein